MLNILSLRSIAISYLSPRMMFLMIPS